MRMGRSLGILAHEAVTIAMHKLHCSRNLMQFHAAINIVQLALPVAQKNCTSFLIKLCKESKYARLHKFIFVLQLLFQAQKALKKS